MPPLAAIVTVTVPLTVAPCVGLVNDAVSGVPFWTVTVREAVAVAPVLSRTVRPSVWLPGLYPVVVHE